MDGTTSHMIRVMQAGIKGITIQYSLKGSGNWRRTSSPCWNWALYNYRIKPEPKVIYVNVFKSGYGFTYPDKASALKDAINADECGDGVPSRVGIKYIEVIEE